MPDTPELPTPRRPLLIIFLTIVVNLVGFGIIIPLLPFYASSLGASPLVVGLMFASFSIAQLFATPVLGALSDRLGRRPVLLFSLVGTVASFVLLALAHSLALVFAARIIDGLSGGNISTARAYIADVTAERDRARAFGLIGAAFGIGLVLGPALGGVFAHAGYAAPIWAAAALTALATALAWAFLPETVHRTRATGMSFRAMPALFRRPLLARLFAIDFLYWCAYASFQTTFAFFGARRFGFDAPHVGYLLALVGALGVVVQLALVGPVVQHFGERRALVGGLFLAAVGLGAASVSASVPVFIATIAPVAIGTGLCNPSLTSLLSRGSGRQEQGRVQGVAGALESLGRTLGPVWGNALLYRLGEGAAFASAAALLVVTAALTLRCRVPRHAPM